MVPAFIRGGVLGPDEPSGVPLHATLAEALEHTAAGSQRGTTFADDGSFVSYAALLASARPLAAHFTARVMHHEGPLVLQLSDRSRHFASLWGAVLGSIPAVSIAVPPTRLELAWHLQGTTCASFNSRQAQLALQSAFLSATAPSFHTSDRPRASVKSGHP